MLSISVVVLFLLAVLLWQGRNLEEQLEGYQEQEQELTRKLADEKERTEEIAQQKEYMATDEYIEETARGRLGMVKENEIVFKEDEEE